MRSAKEKRYEQLHNIMKSIRNSKKIKDFNKMETSFQELTKAYDKAKNVIAKEEGGITPRLVSENATASWSLPKILSNFNT